MRRLLVAIVIVGVVLSGRLSIAQEEFTNHMPENVRKFLDNFVGTWTYVSTNLKGSFIGKWDAGNSSLILSSQEIMKGELVYFTELLYWDGISEDGVISRSVGSDSTGIGCINGHGKVLSPTLITDKRTIDVGEKKGSFDIQVKFNSKDQFVSECTNQVWDGEKQPDMTFKFTRVKPTTREDFEEFCRLNQGAWVGKVPLRQDTPGIGKKGEMATAHYEYTSIEDGAALIGKSYWPGGTNTWFIAYDKESQQIVTSSISPVFGISNPTLRYANRTWVSEGAERNSDGTMSPNTVKGTFSPDGKTLTVQVTKIEDGEKIELTDVWHRMNK